MNSKTCIFVVIAVGVELSAFAATARAPAVTLSLAPETITVSCPPCDGVAPGAWYETSWCETVKNGASMRLLRRVPALDPLTARGRLNRVLGRLKADYPEKRIVLETADPALHEAANVWAVSLAERRDEKTRERAAWRGRRVAFLGDSITDVRHIGCTSNYWNFLARDLGLVPLVYGINGHQMSHVPGQLAKLKAEHPTDVDEICVFAGTNDYNANVPLGDWADGEKTFRGRLARVLDGCAANYPGVRVWLLTPIHRGYATFGPTNVQPDESFANTRGLWLTDYVEAIKEAARRQPSARLIDLNAESGLYPLAESHLGFFHDVRSDRLHPNTAGHARIAAAIMRRWAPGPDADAAGRVMTFTEADAHAMTLYPSNNGGGEKKVVFPLAGLDDVTVDGRGATLVFAGRAFPFAATNCTRLVLRNFTVTTRCPSSPAFRAVEKSDRGFTLEFEAGVSPCRIEGGQLVFDLDGHAYSTRTGRLSLHALDRLSIHYLVTPETPGDRGSYPAPFVNARPVAIDGRKVRFDYAGGAHPKSVRYPYGIGERVAVNLEERRARDIIFLQDCRGVTVENVTFRRFGGMGIVAQRSGDVRVERLSVEPPEGERVSLTADVIQFINCWGDCAIRNCSGGASFDDWVNIHGNYLAVEAVNGRVARLQTRHPSHRGFFPYRVGDSVEFVTAHERTVLACARVLAVEPDAQDLTRCRLAVDSPLPAAVTPGALVENLTLNPNVTIEGNHFRDYPHLRLSGRGRYLVANNVFERGSAAVVGMDLADYWFESGRIADFTATGNVVRACGGFHFGVSGWSGANAPKIHGRIRLEGNHFENVRGAKWSATGVSDFRARD